MDNFQVAVAEFLPPAHSRASRDAHHRGGSVPLRSLWMGALLLADIAAFLAAELWLWSIAPSRLPWLMRLALLTVPAVITVAVLTASAHRPGRPRSHRRIMFTLTGFAAIMRERGCNAALSLARAASVPPLLTSLGVWTSSSAACARPLAATADGAAPGISGARRQQRRQITYCVGSP
jgi:hypothetical protein